MSASHPVWLSLALRVCAGLPLAVGAARAAFSPGMPLAATLAALLVAALTMWRAAAGLIAVVTLAPAGLLLADSPARAAELITWTFLAAWLLCLWRPIGRGSKGSLALACLYAACAVVSWAGYTIRTAAGIEPLWLPATMARGISSAHLVYTSPEPETFTLLPLLAGLALFAAAAAITREHPATRRTIATALAGSVAILGVLTVADVMRQWAGAGYTADYLLRYVRGERFSFHLADLNAAGSLYVLGGLAAIAMATVERQRRALWIALLALMLPALYLSGSRSAVLGALIAGVAVIVLVRRDIVPRVAPAHLLTAALVLGGAGVAVLAAAGGSSQQGTVSNSLWLRTQFMVTSARMFASSPAFGVGIGHYHERSNEFMPSALREVYRHENAHNYFAQQFAELGAVGGVLFLALVASVLWQAWRHTQQGSDIDGGAVALLAACVGYLLTCATGHPLLVPEAALPFWAAFGALAATASPLRVPRAAVALVTLLLAAAVAVDVRRFATATTQPGERGFYGVETGTDGRTFVWMTRHGVFYERPRPGTLVVPVRAPDFVSGGEPFRVHVDIGGRRAGVYEAQPGTWTDIEIPVRDRASGPFRRIDLHVNRSWTPRQVNGSGDEGPRSVMVGETRFIAAGGR